MAGVEPSLAWHRRLGRALFRPIAAVFSWSWTLLKKMWVFFLGTEYARTFQSGEDEHLELVTHKFLQRGRQFMLMSVFMLAGIAVLVFLGVGAFLFPTRFTDVTEGFDVKFEANRQRIGDLLKAQHEVDNKTKMAIEYVDALSPFYELFRDVENATRYEDRITDFRLNEAVFDDSKKLVFALQNKPAEYRIEFKETEYNRSMAKGSQNLSLETRERLEERVATEHGSIANFLQLVTGLRQLPGEAEQILQLVVQTSNDLNWLENEFAGAKRDRNNAIESSNEFGLVRYQQQQQIQDLIAENAQIAAEKVVSDNIGSLGRVVPVLSIRIGIVILFLFLTRILLETYRYTVALAAFYRARGDALQLLGKGSGKVPVAPEDLAKLLVSIAPENHRIEKVSSPENVLLALLRPSAAVSTRPTESESS